MSLSLVKSTAFVLDNKRGHGKGGWDWGRGFCWPSWQAAVHRLLKDVKHIQKMRGLTNENKTASIAYCYTQNPRDQWKHLVRTGQQTDLSQSSECRNYTNAQYVLILDYCACLDSYRRTNITYERRTVISDPELVSSYICQIRTRSTN